MIEKKQMKKEFEEPEVEVDYILADVICWSTDDIPFDTEFGEWEEP